MEIPKPTEEDKEFFLGLIPGDPDVEVKPMFGNLGAFVHGNMFAGLFGPATSARCRPRSRSRSGPRRRSAWSAAVPSPDGAGAAAGRSRRAARAYPWSACREGYRRSPLTVSSTWSG